MDQMDCRILEAVQNDFPLCENPYRFIADKLQISRDQLWDRISRLIDKGLIRRIGCSFDSRKLGFCSTLAAVKVSDDLVERASEVIGAFAEVTHSYLRKDDFNIWFTIIAIDQDRIENILEQIRSTLSLESSQILNLPMKRMFKLNARFDISL